MIPADDPILLREVPVIRKIIQDEMWLEGERRGQPVSAHDTVVRENACKVILRVGQQMRETIEKEMQTASADMKRAE